MIDALRDPHSETELVYILKEKGVDEEFYPRILSQYQQYYKEVYDEMKDYTDEDFEVEGTVKSGALFVLNLYLEPFLKQIKGGHSELWSHLVAEKIEESEWYYYDAYNTLKEIDSELAQKELTIHCHNLSDDEVFRAYYLHLFERGQGYDEPMKRATKYADNYNWLKKEGKSEIYARQYAYYDDISDYNDIYSAEYATAYEMAYNKGLDEPNCKSFALVSGERVAEIKSNCCAENDDDATGYDLERIKAHRLAATYILENNIDKISAFFDTYEHVYLNNYRRKKGTLNEEMLKKEILEETLKQLKLRVIEN